MSLSDAPHTDAAAFLDHALIEEAAKKSALLWVRRAGADTDRPLWHLWHEGAVLVVGDGAEQPLHGLADGEEVTVTVRSKDSWGRLVAWPARVVEIGPAEERWAAAVEELRAKRLNAPDHDTVAERWARESRVLRLEPSGSSSQRPGAMPDGSLAARPLPAPTITRREIPAALPRLVLGRRKRKRAES